MNQTDKAEKNAAEMEVDVFVKRQLLSLALAGLMCVSLATTALASGTAFPDVPPNHWAAKQIVQAKEVGLFHGYPDGGFHPEDAVTGAQFMTVLVNKYCPQDVNVDMAHLCGISGRWYDGQFYAADKNHFLDGLPLEEGWAKVLDAEASRELLVAMLYNAAGRPKVDASALDRFTDRDDVTEYAFPAFCWAVSNGIVSGTSTTTLSPRGTATRAQVAVIMIRYIEKYEGEVPEYVPDPEPTPGTESRNADGTTNAAYVNSISGVNKDAAYPTTGAASSPNANGFYTEADVDIEGCTLQYDALPYLNAFLQGNGKVSAKWTKNDELEEYTLMRAKEAYVNFAHERPDGSSYLVSENLYKGNGGTSSVINAWDKSSGHHATMLGAGRENVSVCIGRYKTCWVLTIVKDGSDRLNDVITLSGNNYYYN